MPRWMLFTGALFFALSVGLVISCGDDDDDDSGGSDDDADDDDDDMVADDTDDDIAYTWTDSSSGLTWKKTLSENMMWGDAKAYCENHAMDGGGWRMPTISEQRTLIRGCDATATGGSCGVMDSCLHSSCQDESCDACINGEGPNDGCYAPSELKDECDWFWSSSVEENELNVWIINFNNGHIDTRYHGDSDVALGPVRCVR